LPWNKYKMQILIIIFAISIIGIVSIIGYGVSKVRRMDTHADAVHPLGRYIGRVWRRIKIIMNYLAHSLAIFLSKIWARISHGVSVFYKKIVTKLENYFRHKNADNIDKNIKTESILLTTIKAYKKEIKKLKGKIEPDEIKSINEDSSKVDIGSKKLKID
jgi:hypothetical protein